MGSTTKKIVASAHKSRFNRVYYEKCFSSINLRENGILQDERKSYHDWVALDEHKNEFLRFYGFDQSGCHFDLSLSILSLYPQADNTQSKWRLADVELTYTNSNDNCRYSYQTRQLIDYSEKRSTSSAHESRGVYRIGSLSIEIVLPFSLSRILFNGYLNKSSLDGAGPNELVSSRLTISTHPNCDKFDYQYRFDPEFTRKTIEEASMGAVSSEKSRKFLELMLEDRIDSPLMYQVRLERSATDVSGSSKSSAIMWGAKVRRRIHLGDGAEALEKKSEPMDDLFVWSKVGHQVHLSRPHNYKRLVNGMVQSSFDYASCLLECKLVSFKADDQTQQQVERESDFNELDTFAGLLPGMGIRLKAYGSKEYLVKIKANKIAAQGFLEVDINGFEGWAMCRTHNVMQHFRQAQSALWTLNIHDRKFAFRLASEQLLGGKGNSLIDLNRLVETKKISSQDSGGLDQPEVSIPRGVIVSCVAYQMWCMSNPLICKSIRELDHTRRTLAARSVYTNPLSDKHMTLAQSQQILREQCNKTCLVLNSCPLPQVLVKHLRDSLREIFTDEELKNPPTNKDDEDDDDDKYKRFAVRSSAVGEDSLETSAAGQMRTILDARGFDSIVRSIVDCWSSQFELEAVMYKTQNGLEFNLPMAVVVQELIPCKAAGVATTCDPLTGNRSNLQILANLGLGEGVVSGNKTDTIRLSLDSLGWDQQSEEHVGHFAGPSGDSNPLDKKLYKVISDGGQEDNQETSCCLSGEQIFALGNLLIWLRRNSQIKDREIEWGITIESRERADPPAAGIQGFRIHLLQSRPLTHLFKLDSNEIDHELDYGFASPLNLVSRANLGEVMPGALCPLTSTYFFPIVANNLPEKPFEHQHTSKPFSAGSFAFHAQVVCMVLTYTDTMSRFGQSSDPKNEQREQQRAVMFKAMIGTTDHPNDDQEARIKLTKERISPMARIRPTTMAGLIALDSGLCTVLHFRARKILEATKLDGDLTSIDSYIERLESITTSKEDAKASTSKSLSVLHDVDRDIKRLFARLSKSGGALVEAWKTHIRATLLNMALNAICMQILSKQAAYPDSMTSSEILNDFSALMQGGEKTESGNISSVLDELIQIIMEEGKLEQATKMNTKELYELLANKSNSSKSSSLFQEFLRKNGHRSFKEFDFSTLTWADDPSYIVKSLATRLRLHKPEEAEKERQAAQQRVQENEAKVREILEKKVQNGRALLNGYLLPRCRNATVRREGSKSLLIETIAKYRAAFRHLGGLLCLAGRLPSADLIFQLSIEELESVVKLNDDGSRADLTRILYKCRRRQQRARLLNQIAYPRPMLDFDDMIEHIRQATGETQPPDHKQAALDTDGTVQVRGLTSCSGCVTGRACVVQSLEDMDQVQPNDILITYSIDISWSVYFFTLAGIVTEVGGIVSHGAVVAREYGIPTLCTAIGACSIFKTGQTVTLDANRSICYLASDAAAVAANKDESPAAAAANGESGNKLSNDNQRSSSQQH